MFTDIQHSCCFDIVVWTFLSSKLAFSLHCDTWKSRFFLLGFWAKLRFFSKPGMRAAAACDHRGRNGTGRSALTIPRTTRSWATRLPTSLPLMRVFKFHANSQGVKQTLEHKGYPRIRKPKENLYLFPLWLLCQMEGTFSCVSCLR